MLILPHWARLSGSTGYLGRVRAISVKGGAAVGGALSILLCVLSLALLCILSLALGDLLDRSGAQSTWTPSSWNFFEGALYPSSGTPSTGWKFGAFNLPYSAPVAGLSYNFSHWCRSSRHDESFACMMACNSAVRGGVCMRVCQSSGETKIWGWGVL